MSKILLVDDDPQSLESTRKILVHAGHEVETASNGQEALERIQPTLARAAGGGFDVIVSDVRMPRMSGMEFLRAWSGFSEPVPVILMTAYGQVDEAVEAMKLGAVDFIMKPFKRLPFLTAVDSALKRSRTSAGSSDDVEILIGESQVMSDLRREVDSVAMSDATVIVTGESGSGKELVAREIHSRSSRSKSPFIALNCAAIPENLIESELFGHEKGAFSGAERAKAGLFEVAHHGTLFLDEIGDMPIALQTRLLRVLQEGEVRRVGATHSKRIDVRVIAATHRDLKEEVAAGRFRQDLLFRLDVLTVKVPALRDRSEDVLVLFDSFLERFTQRHGRNLPEVDSEVRKILLGYSWPGNVRELSNVVERAVVLSDGSRITTANLPEHLQVVLQEGTRLGSRLTVPLGISLEEVEDLLIRKTLEATDGDKNLAARLLGVNPRTIYRKLGGDKEA